MGSPVIRRCTLPAVLPLIAASPSDGTAAAAPAVRGLLASFAAFNAQEAQCFKPEDRQHLLGVIESGWGNFSTFNAMVRSSLVELAEKSAAVERLADGSASRVVVELEVAGSPEAVQRV